MALTVEKIKNIINDGRIEGHDLKYRDVLFCIGVDGISDITLVYQCLYGVSDDVDAVTQYNESNSICWLKDKLKEEVRGIDVDGEGILSNEENAAGLEKLLRDLEKWRKDGDITYKDYASLSVQTRAKLAAMNGSKLRVDEQYIHVYSKFNTICSNCNREYERDTQDAHFNVCPHCHTKYKNNENEK